MSLRRVAAALALVLLLLVVVVTIVTLAGDLPRLLAQLALFAVVLLAGWVAVTRSGWRRVVAAIVAVVAVVAVSSSSRSATTISMASLSVFGSQR